MIAILGRERESLPIDLTDLFSQEVGEKPFLNRKDEIVLAIPIVAYRKVVIQVIPYFRTEHGVRPNGEERAEIYISNLLRRRGPYPSADFPYIVASGRAAINTMMEPNYPAVIEEAKRYRHSSTNSFNFADMIASGYEAMRRAALHFDPNKGIRFVTYARVCMRHGIEKDLNDNAGTIKTSPDKKKT